MTIASVLVLQRPAAGSEKVHASGRQIGEVKGTGTSVLGAQGPRVQSTRDHEVGSGVYLGRTEPLAAVYK